VFVGLGDRIIDRRIQGITDGMKKIKVVHDKRERRTIKKRQGK
jgi:hypothetical protein